MMKRQIVPYNGIRQSITLSHTYRRIVTFSIIAPHKNTLTYLLTTTTNLTTRLIVLRQLRTSPVDSDYALPVVTNFLCRVTNSAHLVVGPSLSLDQRLGIRCRLTSAIRRSDESFRRSLKTFLFAKY